MYDQRPRQRKSDGKWHYTRTYDRADAPCYPVGYCADEGHEAHASEAEAIECYGRYLLDQRTQRVQVDPATAETLSQCKHCGKHTADYVRIGEYTVLNLCRDHQDDATILTHWQPPAWTMGS